MIPKRELTQEQIEEIQALRGRLSADEVKKRFGIGSTRLYKIWLEETAERVTQKALPPADRVTEKPTSLRRHTSASCPTEKSRPSKTFTNGWGPRGPSRAIYETADGGDGPVGAQQRAGGGARRAGGGARRAGGRTRRGNPDGNPESRTNGPKVDLPFHRRNIRLENSCSNLEATRASRTGANCRTGTNFRAEVQEGLLLHGVARPLDVGGFCNIHPDMEIGRRRGGPPRFPFDLFWEQQKAYDSGPERRIWESFEDLRRAAARDSSATILGHIDAETAKNWLVWGLGQLYAVGYRGSVVFCIHGGFVVIRTLLF